MFDHVTIRVSDREASEQFYETVLRDPADLSQINSELLALREAEVDKDLAAVSDAAGRINATAASLELVR
jgi:catechol 2,3-dioxygenase-like lactoylglutathione lyase family enzyme